MSDKLLKISDIMSIFGISRVTVWRWERNLRLPKPVRRFDGAILGWMESDINEWIQKNKR